MNWSTSMGTRHVTIIQNNDLCVPLHTRDRGRRETQFIHRSLDAIVASSRGKSTPFTENGSQSPNG